MCEIFSGDKRNMSDASGEFARCALLEDSVFVDVCYVRAGLTLMIEAVDNSLFSPLFLLLSNRAVRSRVIWMRVCVSVL